MRGGLQIHVDRFRGTPNRTGPAEQAAQPDHRPGQRRGGSHQGRRQVGKSRLIQEFCDRAQLPYVFYTATKGASSVEAVGAFLNELRDSTLPRDRSLVPAAPTASWPDALRALAAVLPDGPSVVVLDELPWLAEQDELFDGALQTAWDRLLSQRSFPHPTWLAGSSRR